MTEIRCISPIDGAVVAVRQSVDVAVATTMIEAARAAQTEWAARPLDERIALVNAGVAALGAANDDIVPELARMMLDRGFGDWSRRAKERPCRPLVGCPY